MIISEKITEKHALEFNFEEITSENIARNYDASNKINALFNYRYAILESEIKKSINSLGIDYIIGFLHKIYSYRAPLVLDLQEFRWIVDYSSYNYWKISKTEKILLYSD